MKKIALAIGVSLFAMQALAATCTKENEGEESCQAGTVKRCAHEDGYKWMQVNQNGGVMRVTATGAGPMFTAQKCDDSSHNEAGGKGHSEAGGRH